MPANRPPWGLLPRRNVHAATAAELYDRLVAQARSPTFYAELGVPDTPEGRLECLMLHVVLMLRRLAHEGAGAAPLAQALAEAFVTDMDDCLREMGVGDMAVATKVKKAAAALFDRSRDYGNALTAGGTGALADLIGMHVGSRGGGVEPGPGALRIAFRADWCIIQPAPVPGASGPCRYASSTDSMRSIRFAYCTPPVAANDPVPVTAAAGLNSPSGCAVPVPVVA